MLYCSTMHVLKTEQYYSTGSIITICRHAHDLYMSAYFHCWWISFMQETDACLIAAIVSKAAFSYFNTALSFIGSWFSKLHWQHWFQPGCGAAAPLLLCWSTAAIPCGRDAPAFDGGLGKAFFCFWAFWWSAATSYNMFEHLYSWSTLMMMLALPLQWLCSSQQMQQLTASALGKSISWCISLLPDCETHQASQQTNKWETKHTKHCTFLVFGIAMLLAYHKARCHSISTATCPVN